MAGRFVLAGHRGLNKVAFRGRVRGRLLGPGIYTIVLQPAAGSRRLPKAVAVAIDARGIRPTAPVRWRNCDPAAASRRRLPPSRLAMLSPAWRSEPPASLPLRRSCRPGAQGPPRSVPPAVFGWLPTVPKSPQLPVLLLGLLAVSIALLSLASVEPGHTLRFRTMRVIARHQVQIAWLGGALLISAILLFLLQ